MTDRDTIKLIVKYLGRAAIVNGLVTGALVAGVIWLSRGRGTVDAAAVALVGLVAQPAMAAITALPSILASTRSAPDQAEITAALNPPTGTSTPTPVNAVNTTADPVAVEQVDAPAGQP